MSLRLSVPLSACLAVSVYGAQHQTALDRYVAAPDPNYKWELVNTIPGEGYTTYVIDLTSQQYLTSAEVDHPVWKHWLIVVKPDKVKSDIGFLYINGGRIGTKAPTAPDAILTSLAMATGSVASMLQGVPNEPVTFAGETKSRTEDAIIAYTWDKFL